MSKKALFIAIFVVLAAVGVGGAVWYTMQTPALPDRSVLDTSNERMMIAYDRIVEFQGKIAENPTEVTNYFVVGNDLKLLADLTGEPVWGTLSLATYKKAIEATNRQNGLILNNAAKIASDIGEYRDAEKYFIEAIDLNPGDASYHLSYIHFLRYKMKASEQEILRAYDDAMTRVVGGADLVANRMTYLKDIGRYDDAIGDLELLHSNNIITEDVYQAELSEIQQLRGDR